MRSITLRHFATKPAELADIQRIYRDSLRARDSLTRFFRAFIPGFGKLL